MNETMKVLLNRRSIRAYKSEQIKDEELQNILDAGRFAPSSMNGQPWHFTAVQNQELLHRISEACRSMLLNSGIPVLAERAKSANFSLFYNAPAIIIASGDEKAGSAHIDCALAMENMFLAAASMDIGSCWIHAVIQLLSSEDNKALKAELGIPEGFVPRACGAFGYKAGDNPAAPPRKENTMNIVK